MPNGWERLGDALAGTSGARRADIEAKTVNALANRDQNVADARMKMERARHATQDSIGSYFLDLASDDPQKVARAKAGIALSGINYNTLEGGLARRQAQGFRQGAVDAAEAGDWALANARLSGVASGPVEIPKVSGNMLLSNRLIPGGGEMSVTPVGQSQIDADRARGEAALIHANRPTATGGGRAGAAPKLSEVQKMRLNAELAALKPRMEAALDEIARNQGATVGPGVRKLAEAQEALRALQAEQDAIFTKYENAVGAPGASVGLPARPNEVNGVAVPAGSSPDELGLLTAMNLEFDRTGQPRLTGDEVRAFRETGSVRRPAAADPVTPAEGAISSRLIDRYAQSLTGYGGAAPAPAAAGPARPTTKAEYDRLPKGTKFIAPDGTTRIKP